MAASRNWQQRIVVAYLDEPPFFAPTPQGRPIGCDIELTEHVVADIGIAGIEWVLTSFGELIPGVVEGRWHVNTPMFVTPERAALIDFSVPVWAAGDGFIVRSDDPRDYSSYEAIADDTTIRLAVVAGQVQHRAALAAGVAATRIVEFEDQDAAARAVASGGVDASAGTAPGNSAYVARSGDPSLAAVADDGGATRGPAPLGAFSFGKQTPELTGEFDAALGRYLGTGDHLAMMARYGFTPESLRPVLGDG